MRSDPTQFHLQAPANLAETLHLLATEPGRHTPIAGGTELMVALNTGRLTQRSFLSLQHLSELRFVHVEPDAIHLGAATTFTDIRQHPILAAEFPLLAQSASWTGSIANQNRATLGGNLCNASPAADNPPALLAYDATVTLISAAGSASSGNPESGTTTRTLPYDQFHLSYKQTALAPGELLFSVTLPRRFANHRHFIRKVGTRNAQAISKVALAATAEIRNNQIREIRLAAASLADRPLRLTATEALLRGQQLELQNGKLQLPEPLLRHARATLANESRPIDDIRSTARYRTAVAANLLEDFLRAL